MKLTDIARLANVSVTTASYVLNGKAAQRRISAATVERVMAVAEQQGFQLDQQAAGLRRGQSRTLGFIVPDLENPSYARLAKLLEQRARQRGYQLLIAGTDDEPDTERQVIQLLRSRRCDALIVASCLPADDQSYRKVQAAGTPVIALDRALDAEHFCSVVSDDCEAAALLTRSLAVPAAAHIALISARPALPISQQREEGFRQALSQHSGQVSILQAEQFSRACGREQMLALLDRGPLPDALITTAYVLLEGVFDALRERNLLWPEQLRLATFGDAQLLDFLPIRVNAISQQHEQIAEQTLEQAIRAIEQGDYRPGVIAIERELKSAASLIRPLRALPRWRKLVVFRTRPPSQMNIEQITQRLHAIRDQNDWQRFHSPKNLAMAASVEMAELVEIFQWQTEDESRQLSADKLEHAGQEVGDILMYLLLMCSELGIDMEQALLAKLADNERRFAR